MSPITRRTVCDPLFVVVYETESCPRRRVRGGASGSLFVALSPQ